MLFFKIDTFQHRSVQQLTVFLTELPSIGITALFSLVSHNFMLKELMFKVYEKSKPVLLNRTSVLFSLLMLSQLMPQRRTSPLNQVNFSNFICKILLINLGLVVS